LPTLLIGLMESIHEDAAASMVLNVIDPAARHGFASN
jgi:hypothetical protein